MIYKIRKFIRRTIIYFRNRQWQRLATPYIFMKPGESLAETIQRAAPGSTIFVAQDPLIPYSKDDLPSRMYGLAHGKDWKDSIGSHGTG